MGQRVSESQELGRTSPRSINYLNVTVLENSPVCTADDLDNLKINECWGKIIILN